MKKLTHKQIYTRATKAHDRELRVYYAMKKAVCPQHRNSICIVHARAAIKALTSLKTGV
jgi:hypothetical protein